MLSVQVFFCVREMGWDTRYTRLPNRPVHVPRTGFRDVGVACPYRNQIYPRIQLNSNTYGLFSSFNGSMRCTYLICIEDGRSTSPVGSGEKSREEVPRHLDDCI